MSHSAYREITKPYWDHHDDVYADEVENGWEPKFTSWYQHTIVNDIARGGFDWHFDTYEQIAKWIPENVEDWANNAQWLKVSDCIYVRFKREKDYVWFMLKWG